MEVNVGQILFVLNAKNHTLLPAQVNEVVVSRTIKGETVQHILVLQGGKKIVLEKLKSPWFTELDSAKSFLLSEAEKMIDTVISRAQSEANEYFDVPQEALPFAEPQAPSLPTQAEEMTVDLGDGRKARVTLPEEFTIENPSS